MRTIPTCRSFVRSARAAQSLSGIGRVWSNRTERRGCRPNGPGDRPAIGPLPGPELHEDGKDLLPHVIRDLPDGARWLGLRFPSGLALGPGHAGTLLSVAPL